MPETKKPLIFSVSRHDLLYNFAETLDEIFAFAPKANAEPSSDPGVQLLEDEGFDFAAECAPVVIVRPAADLISKATGIAAKDLMVHISIEDVALGMRQTIFELPVEKITAPVEQVINLRSFPTMAFVRGFEVRCFITRRVSIESKTNLIWHKSQIAFERFFSAKTNSDDALFDISWMNFSEKDEAKDLLYFVDWDDFDVSNLPAHDCFKVVANEALRNQFRRLENNSHFGHFAVRLMVQDLLQEIVGTCLHYSNLDIEPAEGSLHDKVQTLLSRFDYDFGEAAKGFKSKEPMTVLEHQASLNRLLQTMHGIGSELSNIRFGGYRSQ